MISYKVLITLTVIFIINCGGSGLTREDYDNCERILKKVGFSNDFGYLNYCFAMQFGNKIQFENYLKNVCYPSSTAIDNLKKVGFSVLGLLKPCFEKQSQEAYNTSPAVIIDIAKAFFNESMSYWINEVLYNPAEFCNFVHRGEPCWESSIVSTSKNDDKIIQIKTDGITIEDIEYGKNKLKNAIKSYNFSLVNESKRKEKMESWNEYKRKYYEYQMKNLNEKEDSNKFLTTTKWCEQKKAELKDAEDKMAEGKAAENVDHV